MVKVFDDGFEYNGHRYKSLSAIAQEITGAKWNGFLFFGIAGNAASRQGSRKPKRSC